ncbi:anti-phage-associated DUF3780 domain-containing protein [Ferrimonas balearica]|uniref:anti-phage-associated DUF3780 domain-containing protein n=1 Tax=Ferrimonas balearica TaxID=44012 RepID=UPI001C9772E1|nr:anti-phage-associated DUF3780 domain-containing protein [Ferrimonas balearica]MBY6226421.1 DUF3780 and DUF4357 domain-containing protein [Ferrimonas balearica]
MAKATTKKTMTKLATLGFGVPASSDPHHFKVIIPKANSGDVQISEYLGLQAQNEALSIIDRVFIERSRWTAIRSEVQRMFNARLKDYGAKISTWKVGENLVDRLLGKELCVLAWAVEGMEMEHIPVAVRNWLALRPEERWWLFGMTAMSTGLAEDRDVGWRVALRHALGDIVQTTQLESEKASPAETSSKPSGAVKEPPASYVGLLPKPNDKPLPLETTEQENTLAEDTLFLFEAKQAKAGGHPVGDMSKPEFLVQKGSTANIKEAKSLRPALRELRQELVNEKVLVEEGDVYSFSREYTFKSPSAAACVIAGNPRSGMDAWRDPKGRSLKELGYGKSAK